MFGNGPRAGFVFLAGLRFRGGFDFRFGVGLRFGPGFRLFLDTHIAAPTIWEFDELLALDEHPSRAAARVHHGHRFGLIEQGSASCKARVASRVASQATSTRRPIAAKCPA